MGYVAKLYSWVRDMFALVDYGSMVSFRGHFKYHGNCLMLSEMKMLFSVGQIFSHLLSSKMVILHGFSGSKIKMLV